LGDRNEQSGGEEKGDVLLRLRAGECAVVIEARVDASDAAYLRAMGVRPGARLRVSRLGEPTIVELLSCGMGMCGQCGCRIGLARNVAERVVVQRG
jgi:Fe2+ transport system protein FeoA